MSFTCIWSCNAFVRRYFCSAQCCAHINLRCYCKTWYRFELGCATVFLADVVDYGEFKLGTRNEGVVFSLQTLIVKFTAPLTALGIVAALGSTQYIPGQEQSFATVASISTLMCIVPAVCMLIAYVVYRKKYKLNDGMMKKVINSFGAR